ncbi:thiamine-binding protein [Catenuloplanes japonicus]|uniref:thiamine-binding protein n=1 Tax=Catenuloplanes japonicus TaxID=33876 RepID=UPI000526AB27|nr:thiamine-binding protein [Catenuloplanes japonicus]
MVNCSFALSSLTMMRFICVGMILALVQRWCTLRLTTDAMFTTVEGETWDEVMGVVKAAVEAVKAVAPRASVVIKVDWRDGVTGAMDSKVATVERVLS